MKKKMKILILFSLVIAILGGCYDIREVEDQLIVMMLGIEKEEEGYKLYYFTVDPREYKANPKTAMYMLTTKAQTLKEGLANIDKDNPRKPMLTHAKIFLIGEKLFNSHDDMIKIINELMADKEIDKNMYMMVVTNSIADLGTAKSDFNELISNYLIKLNKNWDSMTLEDAVIKMSKDEKKISFPRIKIVENKIKPEKEIIFNIKLDKK